jgi:hypothetical protein
VKANANHFPLFFSATLGDFGEVRRINFFLFGRVSFAVGFLSFALIIGNSVGPKLGCHSGGILFQSSTVLNNKQDASSMTFSLLLLQTSIICPGLLSLQ